MRALAVIVIGPSVALMVAVSGSVSGNVTVEGTLGAVGITTTSGRVRVAHCPHGRLSECGPLRIELVEQPAEKLRAMGVTVDFAPVVAAADWQARIDALRQQLALAVEQMAVPLVPMAVIDRPGGITVDHCAEVSRQLSRVLEVEGIDYDRLEVSSPGLDRPLCKPADFTRFAGSKVDVKMRTRDESGRKRFTGLLRGEAGGVATLVARLSNLKSR